MRKSSVILPAALSLLLSACSSYDDTFLTQRMDQMEKELGRLEGVAATVNADIASASDIMLAFGKGDYVTSCQALEDGSGYVITFSASAPITVHHGTNGVDGTDGTDAPDGTDAEDGISPVVGIAKDETGAYCWTLNGSYLLDGEGGHVYLTISTTEGKDGTVPQLRVKDGMWQLSLNNGYTWTDLVRASASAQASPYIFSKVEPLEDVVRFTLSDGSTFDLLRLGTPCLELSGWQGLKVVPGRSVDIAYTVSGATSRTVVRAVGNHGYTARVKADSVSSGTITVLAPAEVVDGEVLVVADNGFGCLSIRKMTFSTTGITVTELEGFGNMQDFEW